VAEETAVADAAETDLLCVGAGSPQRRREFAVTRYARYLCLSIVFALTACHAEPAPQAEHPASARIDPAGVAFGYTNATNTRLLMMVHEKDSATVARAQRMETAVCSEGRSFPIRYTAFQEGSPKSNGRQSAGNLENDQGYLYELVREGPPPEAGQGGETCLILLMRHPRAPRYFANAASE
jgi:hypothetical protein